MNRQKAKNINQTLRDPPKNPDNFEQERCELTLDDLPFLGSDGFYHSKHIAGVAKGLCKKHGVNFGQQFEIVGSTEQLTNFLKKTDPAHDSKNPLFIIYCVNKNHWVTFCVTHSPNGVIVLYKDSLGGDIPRDIRKILEKNFDGVTFRVHQTKEQKDANSCGPLALRNMEIIMELLKDVREGSVVDIRKGSVVDTKKGYVVDTKGYVVDTKGYIVDTKKGYVVDNKKGSVDNKNDSNARSIVPVGGNKLGSIANFENKLFCSSKEIESVKKKFKEAVGKDIVDTCAELANEIAGNTEFKQEVVKLIDSCGQCVEVLRDIEKYVEHLQSETDKDEGNPDYEVELIRRKAYKDKIMEHPEVKAWSELARKAIRDSEIPKKQADTNDKQTFWCQTELEQKYPELLKKFTKVFTLLGKDLRYEQSVRDKGVQQVSKILEIDYKKIKLFYETLKVDAPQPDNSQKEVVLPIDIEELAKKFDLKKPKQISVAEDNVKPTPEILAEIAFETANVKERAKLTAEEVQKCPQKVYKNNAEVLELKTRYDEVKKHYKLWKDKSGLEIKTWARNHRGGLSNEDLYEVVAVMDRANELVTGHFLRDTQILAVLDSLNCTDRKGKLCQIATGEGKTVIVSLIAAIKVLQGKQVDVITSNEVLAEEGVNTRGNFFGVLGISVAHNNPDEKYRHGPRKCYTADAVYGSMGSFQFDYLKDSFEGLKTRGSRRFEFVILDEVDSLLLDNGGHIAKLGEPFPGFESLKYVYIKIWQELAKAEQELVIECEEGLKRKAEELTKRQRVESTARLQEQYMRYRAELFNNQDKLVEKIKKSDPANIDLIPVHLREFARDMVDSWIKNAIYAKYSCQENEQYVVRKLEDGKEPRIVPVDYQGTGVTLKNTMWSNGLHQFVQLKHNLQLTSETMTSSLISNIGYVKLYDSNLFGLTGTLGSTAEQKLLSEVYDVSYSKIPTYKAKVFKEICGKVIADDQFKKSVVEDVLELTSKKRSVLIICSTINEALGLEKKIKKSGQVGLSKISTYFDETNSKVVQQVIDVGEIIISTNIAGRGSDFKTTSELEANGGLEVRLCFLPVNQRVEDQAFGRTSRQGNKGTAQIVMRESEVQGLGFATVKDLPFKEIKDFRDVLEADRLERVRKVDLAEIDFYDSIFGLFSNLYRKAMKTEEEIPSMLYLLKDLKECWAFWLHKKQKKDGAVANVHEEFEKFKREARPILGEEKDGTFVGGKIIHNPYYSIQQAEHLILNDLYESARTSLNHALKMSGKNVDLLYAAHIKMFEVELEQGQAIMNRFLIVVKRVVPFEFTIKKEEGGYKNRAKAALEKAKKALETEIRYIERNFTGDSSNERNPNQTGNQDFVNILNSDTENVLVRHISSRLSILQTFLNHVIGLLEQITRSITGDAHIALSARVPDFWRSNNLTELQRSLVMLMGGADGDEFRELFSVGLGTMFAVADFPTDFEIKPFFPGLIQIGIGLAALGTGAAFPPSLPVMAKIAEVFICEGIADIIVYIITGTSKFDIKSKLISYGTQTITIGIFALLKYTKLAQKAINMCRRLIAYLEASPNLRRLSEVLVPVLEKVISTLEGQIRIARSATVSLSEAAFKIGKAITKKISLVVVQHKVITNAVDVALNPQLPVIKGYVHVVVFLRINETLLRSVRREVFLQRTKEVLDAKSTVGFIGISCAIAENIANSYDYYKSLPWHQIECEIVVVDYTEAVCSDLRKLQPIGDGDASNDEAEVQRILVELVDMISKHILGQIKKKTVKFVMKHIARAVKKI